MKSLAPIILFVYNRPNHTKRTIEALSANYLAEKSELFIYSDAPKNESEQENVEAVRNYIKMINGFKKVKIIERTQNFGLVKSIKEGVSEIVNSFGKVIVIEDDLITHPQFLEFVNKALDLYEEKKEVFSITGYSHFDFKENEVFNQLYFAKIISTWTWATWSDRWAFYDDNITDTKILNSDKKVRRKFNYDNSYNYYKLLNDQRRGMGKSWGIIWYWNVFKVGGVTLYPTATLVEQIGFDGSGENSRNYNFSWERIKNTQYEFIFPNLFEEDALLRQKLVKVLKKRKLMILYSLIKSKIIRFLNTKKK